MCFRGHLSRTPSAPARPCCTRMPGPASTLAFCWWGHLAGTTSAPVGPWYLCYLGHLSGTPSAPAGLAASGCLDQHRFMPCVSGASPTSAPVGPWYTKVPRAISAHACASRGTCLAHHQHQRGLVARGCLDQHRLLPFTGGGTWLAQHQHRWDLGAYAVWGTCLARHRHQRALLRADASTSIGSCLVCLGLAQHLHRWGLGAPRCLEKSRHMVVLLRAHVS